MKILILTSYTPHNIYLVNALTDRKNIVGKVIQKRRVPASQKEKMDIRRRMARRHGFIKTANKLLYNKWKSLSVSKNEGNIVKDMLFNHTREPAYTKDIPTIEVQDINSSKCRDFISAHNPDVVAVCGTSVIKPEIFTLSQKGTINIHCGIIPEYRSADPSFWALYNGEPDKVGVTIHFVDAGIDTGDIIYQETVQVTKDDNLATLYCKCIKTGAELMAKAIDDIEHDNVKRIKKDNVSGKAYYHMDLGILQYFVFQRKFKKLKKTLLK